MKDGDASITIKAVEAVVRSTECCRFGCIVVFVMLFYRYWKYVGNYPTVLVICDFAQVMAVEQFIAAGTTAPETEVDE